MQETVRVAVGHDVAATSMGRQHQIQLPHLVLRSAASFAFTNCTLSSP